MTVRLAIAGAGRAIFRHKTRKHPFCSNLHTIAVLQFVALVTAIVYSHMG